MNKGELVDKLYRENSLTKRECREMVGSLVETIAERVAEGEEVKLMDFGEFSPFPRSSTSRVHPVTGKVIDVPAKVVPKFSSGKGFSELVEENLKTVRNGSGELEVKQDR
ncbi:HU family DNA-binding protein [Candidatus Bipolaricaulota bacterium]|nr:HU family DNA-binding protein [Candidatus Bipolaricaulota bacterium]